MRPCRGLASHSSSTVPGSRIPSSECYQGEHAASDGMLRCAGLDPPPSAVRLSSSWLLLTASTATAPARRVLADALRASATDAARGAGPTCTHGESSSADVEVTSRGCVPESIAALTEPALREAVGGARRSPDGAVWVGAWEGSRKEEAGRLGVWRSLQPPPRARGGCVKTPSRPRPLAILGPRPRRGEAPRPAGGWRVCNLGSPSCVALDGRVRALTAVPWPWGEIWGEIATEA